MRRWRDVPSAARAAVVLVAAVGAAASLGVVAGRGGDRDQGDGPVAGSIASRIGVVYAPEPTTCDGNPCQVLDLYATDLSPARRRPVAVFIHGGGWEGGSRGTLAGDAYDLAGETDWLVANVAYDTDRYPALWHQQPADIAAALTWIRQHARELGADMDRVALIGESAGGHLAALHAYRHPDQVRVVVTLGAPFDLARLASRSGCHEELCREDADKTTRFTGFAVQGYVGGCVAVEPPPPERPAGRRATEPLEPPPACPERYRDGSPLTWAKDGPLTVLVSSEGDPLVSVADGTSAATALTAQGVDVRTYTVGNACHGRRCWRDAYPAVEPILREELEA